MPETTPTPAPAPTHHRLTRRLLDSPIFAARAAEPQQRDHAVRALDVLLTHGHSLAASTLGPLLGVPARRVGGFVVKASEVLNIDGYAVLHYDPLQQQVQLHVERLLQCFEIERP